MAINRITFHVPGIPQPGGSKRAVPNPKTGRAMLIDACKGNKDWRTAVAWCAKEAMRGHSLPQYRVCVETTFFMPRLKSHYRANGNLKESAPEFHTVRPDATKLWRSTEDAMTGIVWRDDAQIAHQVVSKRYSSPPINTVGAVITVEWES